MESSNDCIGCFWENLRITTFNSLIERMKSSDWDIIEIPLNYENQEWTELNSLDKLRQRTGVRFDFFIGKSLKKNILFIGRNKLMLQYWKSIYDKFPQSLYDPFPTSKPVVIYLKRRWLGHSLKCANNSCQTLEINIENRKELVDKAEKIIDRSKKLYSVKKLGNQT